MINLIVVPLQPSGPALKSDALFAQIQAGAKSNPGMAKKINSVFLFDILKDGKSAAKWSKIFCLYPR